FASLAPDPAQSEALRAKAARLLPPLSMTPVLDAQAGVRVTVPGTRLPLLGPLPGRPTAWVFTGLGAKGLLTAPVLAQALPPLPARAPPAHLDALETTPPGVGTLGCEWGPGAACACGPNPAKLLAPAPIFPSPLPRPPSGSSDGRSHRLPPRSAPRRRGREPP